MASLIMPALPALATTTPATIGPAFAGSMVSRVLPAWRSFSTSSAPRSPRQQGVGSCIQGRVQSPSRSATLSPIALAALNPFMLRFLPLHANRSAFHSSAFAQPRSLVSRIPTPPSYRTLATVSGGGAYRNMLASREATANRNPQSATAQSAFYGLLLSANMPQIMVERYASGQFARNEACDGMYHRALSMMNPASSSSPAAGAPGSPGMASGSQLQAAGQAVAAQTHGANLAVAYNKPADGSRQGPLHVRVDETTGATVFRWFKFIAWFVLFTYLSLVLVTLLIDGINTLPNPNKRSGARGGSPQVKSENQKARFSDVHGCDEAKEELQDLVDFLKNPDKFNTLGGKLPKGVLLVGPPGTGKTLLARAVAGEAGVPFFYMSGSEFDEVYVGVGAKRVRDLFSSAKAKSPAIIFIDELDAVGGRRNSRDAAYVKQTLNQLLTELDGFEQNSGVIILAATNFPELLDKALTRPGRFDRNVIVGLPDARGRIAILTHHAQKIKAAIDIDLKAIALTTVGLSGAELENIVNEAAVHASKNKATEVTMRDFEWAKDKVIMGAERKTMVINPKEKEMTAYHEAGHALIRWYTNPKMLHKVTILPRGMTLGHMAARPEIDKYSYTAADYMEMIMVAYGGLVAEELVYGVDKTTSGVTSDIESATKTAFRMVASFGMSKELGPVEYSHRYNTLSSETKAAIELEVRQRLSKAYESVKSLLTKNRVDLDNLAQALLKYETLDRSEVGKVLKGEDLPDRIPVPPGSMVIHPTEPLDGEDDSNMGESSPPPATPSTTRPPPPPPVSTPKVN